MNRTSARLALLAATAVGSAAAAPLPARAYPHVWVSVQTTVVTGLRQRWLFDELYFAMGASFFLASLGAGPL